MHAPLPPPLPRLVKHGPRSKEPDEIPEVLDLLGKDGQGGGRIRCPRCAWEPRAESRWRCECGHAWNTFDTRGRCPVCDVLWEETQCHRCHLWSAHRDWYADGSQPES